MYFFHYNCIYSPFEERALIKIMLDSSNTFQFVIISMQYGRFCTHEWEKTSMVVIYTKCSRLIFWEQSSVSSLGTVLDHWGQGKQLSEKVVCQPKGEMVVICLVISSP